MTTGIFILVHETLEPEPSQLLLAAGLLLLGLPAALFLDRSRDGGGGR